MSQLRAPQARDLTRDIQQNNLEFTKLCVRQCDTLKNIYEDRLNEDEKHCLRKCVDTLIHLKYRSDIA